eukprot:5931992-Pyramimonas_sp.AAC.1
MGRAESGGDATKPFPSEGGASRESFRHRSEAEHHWRVLRSRLCNGWASEKPCRQVPLNCSCFFDRGHEPRSFHL